MKRYLWFVAVALASVLVLIGPGLHLAAQSGSEPTPTPAVPVTPDNVTIAAFEGVLRGIYERVGPSVVHIQVIHRGIPVLSLLPPDHPDMPDDLPDFPDDLELPQREQQGTGSGFVWDTKGHIVTNNHVIEGAEEITVIFNDGTIVSGEIVGTDPDNDLAVLKVDMPAERLQPVELGDSREVQVGELVVALGNPFGLESTLTAGIVSALGRMLPVETSGGPLLGSFSIPDVIQTDAAINPGNSGGVLLNDQGEVIGVTSAIISPIRASAGVGFAIPVAMVEKVIPVLIEKGRYLHSWLGISGFTLPPDVAESMGLDGGQRGALVVDVVPGGPADGAGVRGSDRQVEIKGHERRVGGDVIVAVDGAPITGFDDIVAYLARHTEIGQTMTLTVLRQGEEKEIEVKLTARPGENDEREEVAGEEKDAAWLGVVGVTLDPEIADAMRLPPEQEGVLVEQVQQGSPADKAGIRGSYKPIVVGETRVLVGGDVVTAADDEPITTMEDLVEFVRGSEPGQEITLRVLRDGEETEIEVTLGELPGAAR